MPSVFINPTYQGPDRADGGIRRVTEALVKYLPEYGWTPSYGPDYADLIMNHGASLCDRPGIPSIAACHGLYWLGYKWPLWTEDANRRVTDVIMRAAATTSPSRWVAGAIQRGLLRQPHVIYHGVDTDDWIPPEDGSQPYVLWNKARKDPVSNPDYMQVLAGMLPNIPFVSTLGQPSQNVKIIGVHPYSTMRRIVERARIGLITTRETMGIGTLEMLAAGVPIVGWDYGGQAEIIKQNETGILVPYGDYGALSEAVQTVWNDRGRFSISARQDAVERWQWHDKIKQYADLFDRVLGWHRQYADSGGMPKVSFIVTCYNLGQYLPEALRSVQSQDVGTWECVIVDDGSTDNTADIAGEWAGQDARFVYVKTPENLGLSGARNFGVEQSRGKYIIFLDADDMLDRTGVSDLVDSLDNDNGLHIAFGSLDTIQEDGSGRKRNPWPDSDFDWRAQTAHLNQLPYASIMRRSVFDAVGGYRARDWRAEDASFWIRATSHGFRASRVTSRPALVYRIRGDSKSGRERNQFRDADGDWTSWFPWRLGASSGQEGSQLEKSNKAVNPLMVPFGAQGDPPAPHLMWPVRHHTEPLVSVVIPVGPGHEKYIVDALDSLVAQTFAEWEVVVINDTDLSEEEFSRYVRGHPYARVLKTPIQGSGAGKSRNMGIQASRGDFLFFLDADDWLRPDALEKMLDRYAQDGGYIYSDCVALTDSPESLQYTSCAGRNWSAFSTEPGDGTVWKVEAEDYDRIGFLGKGYTPQQPGAHSVSILIAKSDMLAAGGFDEKMAFWEDWEAMLKIAKLGVCGQHVTEPLLTYRLTTGRRRRAAQDIEAQLQKILAERYERVQKEVDNMCSCGSGGQSLQDKAKSAVSPFQRQNATSNYSARVSRTEAGVDAVEGFSETEKVLLRYVGRKSAPVPYVGKFTGTVYRASLGKLHEVIEVDPRDVEGFLQLREFVLLNPVDRPDPDSVEQEGATVQW